MFVCLFFFFFFFPSQHFFISYLLFPPHKTATGEDVMNPGEVGTLKVARPLNAKTYRVWLVK